jgi:hypothetical protein
LRFVPCKELISISLVLKAQQSVGCCSLAAQSLAAILKFDPIFKDVFREVGESAHFKFDKLLMTIMHYHVEVTNLFLKCFQTIARHTASVLILLFKILTLNIDFRNVGGVRQLSKELRQASQVRSRRCQSR